MIRHVVLYAYRAEFSDNEIANIYNELEEISGKLPGRISYTWGKYESPEGRNQGFTHCLVTDFADETARNAFLTDPIRLAFSKREVLPRMINGVNSIISFDFIC